MVNISPLFVIATAGVLFDVTLALPRPGDKAYDLSALRWDLGDSYNPGVQPQTNLYHDENHHNVQHYGSQHHPEYNYRDHEDINPYGKYTVPPEYHSFEEESRHHGIDKTPLSTPATSPVREGDANWSFHGGETYVNRYHNGELHSHQLPEDWLHWGDDGLPVVKPIPDRQVNDLGIRYRNKLDEAESYQPEQGSASDSDGETSWRGTKSPDDGSTSTSKKSGKQKSKKWWKL